MTLTKQQRVKRREQSLILYALERKWGVVADFYQETLGPNNYETGKPTVDTVKTVLPRFVTHGAQLDKKFEYDLSFLAANKNFTYGGVYTPGTRVGIFRSPVLGFIVKMEGQYIVYEGKRYSFETVEELDFQLGWIVKMKHTPGTTPRQSHDRAVWSRVTPIQSVEVEP